MTMIFGRCPGEELAWRAGEEPQPSWSLNDIIESIDALPAFDDEIDYDEALDEIVDDLVAKHGESWREAIKEDLSDLLGR